jgi:hypothetical protein
MTDTQTQAVARRPELTPDMQREVEARRLHSAMVQKIRGATWGNSFDATTIAAVAAWARENDVDPVTDLDVLGGKLYINARWYEKKLSQLIAAGQIEYARKDWVHIDKRLEKLADSGDVDAKKESLRRLKARIAHNLSDDADAACVFRIRHRQAQGPGRRLRANGDDRNPRHPSRDAATVGGVAVSPCRQNRRRFDRGCCRHREGQCVEGQRGPQADHAGAVGLRGRRSRARARGRSGHGQCRSRPPVRWQPVRRMTKEPAVDLTTEFWRLPRHRETVLEQNGGRIHVDHMLRVLRARLVVDLSGEKSDNA